MAYNITDITARVEARHRNLSMCVEIACLGIDAGQVFNMVSALQLVRRTPWGRAEAIDAIKSALDQSGCLTYVSISGRV
jgi:hypothetical protein